MAMDLETNSADASHVSNKNMTQSTAYCVEWENLFSAPGYYAELRNCAIRGDLRSCHFRSICWKLYLSVLPEDTCEWQAETSKLRSKYTSLKKKFITNPRQEESANLLVNHPLSQSENSPWNQHFIDEELKVTIKQDVRRTFPEIRFFQTPSIQQMMVDILFCYAREYPNLDYKQGMHEVLAPLIFVIHCDQQAYLHARDNEVLRDPIHFLLDPDYIEHDGFSMFCEVMETVDPWYQTKDIFPVRDTNPSNVLVNKLNRVQDKLLKKHDYDLYQHLEKMEIPPQIYGIRWVRLLFGREFPMQDLLVLWDAIFADSMSFDLVDHMFVAMMIFIREKLLRSDYAGCLTVLMKYPPVNDIFYLIKRALYLRKPTVYPNPKHYPGQLPGMAQPMYVTPSAGARTKAAAASNITGRAASIRDKMAARPSSLSLRSKASTTKDTSSKETSRPVLRHPLENSSEEVVVVMAGAEAAAATSLPNTPSNPNPFLSPANAAAGKQARAAVQVTTATKDTKVREMVDLTKKGKSGANRSEAEVGGRRPEISRSKRDSFFKNLLPQKSISREEMEEIGRDLEYLQSRLTSFQTMCSYCATMMDTNIELLQQTMLQRELPLEDDMYIGLAGLKQVRDMLKGTLGFTSSVVATEAAPPINDRNEGQPSDGRRQDEVAGDATLTSISHGGSDVTNDGEGIVAADDGEGVVATDDGEGVVDADDGEGMVAADDGEGVVDADDEEGIVAVDDGEDAVVAAAVTRTLGSKKTEADIERDVRMPGSEDEKGRPSRDDGDSTGSGSSDNIPFDAMQPMQTSASLPKSACRKL
ncbi:PREDICTED: TBC1 domain family member 5-like isoform X2 [Priapulus caudatus]|uniref:TBC1 domain family member 5-like isoform X2 n=1 Tax=Priapulus caudatus TaxID=37621 RepID=A0ABM1EIP6_PRICU|nr:PREDICTED: TBC1 domain family member 5-like isoform X2 [Priapulus caudatus]